MKRKILSQLFIVSFAFVGLFLVGNNVRGVENPPGSAPAPGWSCSVSVNCSDGGSVACTGVDKTQGCIRNSHSGYVVCDGVTTWC